MIALMERYEGKWLSLGAGLSGLLVIALMLSFPQFRVRKIQVERDYGSPPPLVDEGSLARRLAWVRGSNVFSLNTARLAGEINAEPSIQAAVVETRIDGTVIVRVTHRAPVANWEIGGRSYLVGPNGGLLAEGRDGSLGLTVIDTEHAAAKPGDRVNVDALEAAYKLSANLPILGVTPSRIAYSGMAGLVVTDSLNREITFGPPDFLRAKLVALQAVLDEAARKGERINRVDLRPVDRPTYQIEKGG